MTEYCAPRPWTEEEKRQAKLLNALIIAAETMTFEEFKTFANGWLKELRTK